jgi:hypothetical protein
MKDLLKFILGTLAVFSVILGLMYIMNLSGVLVPYHQNEIALK